METNKTKIAGCHAELVRDEQNDCIEVATITNRHDRIVRLIVKGGFACTAELSYCERGHYQWAFESVNMGLDELIEIGKIAQYVKDRED